VFQGAYVTDAQRVEDEVHRLRISNRDRFDGILARLVTGCSWDVAARLKGK